LLFFFQAEDGIRYFHVTGVQTCALPIFTRAYDLSEKNRLFNSLEHVSLALANVYESLGNMKRFAHYIRKHLAYRDSNARVTKLQIGRASCRARGWTWARAVSSTMKGRDT